METAISTSREITEPDNSAVSQVKETMPDGTEFDYHKLCLVHELKEGAGKPFTRDGTHLAVFLYDGKYPRRGQSLSPHGLPDVRGKHS